MTPRIELTHIGQIEHLAIPAGWVERDVEVRPMQLFTLREFHPPDRPQERLYIYYRGHPVSENSGEAFEKLLEQPPHDLDEAEWWSVQEIVGNAALETAFERRRARTYDWAGKRVLVVDGHWTQLQEDSFLIYINAADHGCQVQEIQYVAPTTEFQNFLPDILLSLSAIKWKGDGGPTRTETSG